MKKSIKYALLILFAAAVIYVLKFSPLSYYFFTVQGKEVFGQKFGFYLARIGIWAPFIFMACLRLSIILFIPASVFSSLGGIIFGSWLGLLLNIIAANIGGGARFPFSQVPAEGHGREPYTEMGV